MRFVFTFLLLTSVQCLKLKIEFANNCKKNVSVVNNVHGEPSKVVATLAPGEKTSLGPFTSLHGIGFADGEAATSGAFFIVTPEDGEDFYGFKTSGPISTPMQITSAAAQLNVTCNEKQCDGTSMKLKNQDDGATFFLTGAKSGVTPTLTFCP